MRRLLLAAAVLSFSATRAAAAEPIVHGPAATAAAVLAAEKQYSDRFGVVGMAQGMREFVDPVDGLAFAGGDPARGAAAAYEAFGGGAPATARLAWIPAEVFAATGGDMAASWGRYTLTDAAGKRPAVTGRYVTVWRKAADGAWKAIMDIGNPDPPPGR